MLEPVAPITRRSPRLLLRCSRAYQDGKGESGGRACLVLSVAVLSVASATPQPATSALRQAFQKRIVRPASFSASKSNMFSSTAGLGRIDSHKSGRWRVSQLHPFRSRERLFSRFPAIPEMSRKQERRTFPAIPAPPIRGRERNGKKNGKMKMIDKGHQAHHSQPSRNSNRPRFIRPVIAACVRSVWRLASHTRRERVPSIAASS